MSNYVIVTNITSNSVKLDVIGSFVYLGYFFRTTLGVSGSMGLGDINSTPFTLPSIEPGVRIYYNSSISSIVFEGLTPNTTYYYDVYYYDNDYQVYNDDGVLRIKSDSFTTSALGGGAGSDPYITTFSGHTFELPHLNKHWNLLTHKSTDFSIIAHTHNYPTGNFFNEIKVKYGNLKATIDYQKKKIRSNNSEFKVGKTQLIMKYNKQGEIIEEEKLFDCIVFNHPEFEEVVLLVNWRNDYFHPMFKVKPIKDCSGLLMKNEPSKIL
jgi:hypothetical protein